MIDFSTVQEVAIPEGVVTQIADESGKVLWSRMRTAMVKITSQCVGINGDTSSITITSAEPFAPDPSNPSNTVTEWTVVCYEMPNCTIEIPIGSTIECVVRDTKQSNRCYITLNGTNVVEGPGTYLYTVKRNVTVDVSDKYSMGEYGAITITE